MRGLTGGGKQVRVVGVQVLDLLLQFHDCVFLHGQQPVFYLVIPGLLGFIQLAESCLHPVVLADAVCIPISLVDNRIVLVNQQAHAAEERLQDLGEFSVERRRNGLQNAPLAESKHLMQAIDASLLLGNLVYCFNRGIRLNHPCELLGCSEFVKGLPLFLVDLLACLTDPGHYLFHFDIKKLSQLVIRNRRLGIVEIPLPDLIK